MPRSRRSRSREFKLRVAIAALIVGVLGASLLSAPHALAQGADHGSQGFIVLDELDMASRQRARELFSEIVCKCPRENWSKTLLNCPDGCSDPQKQEILHQIEDGWDDQKIVDYQVKMYSSRALGKPDDVLTYLLPALVLVGAAAAVAFVFSRWRVSSAQAREDRSASAPAADDELAAVQRELEELR